MSWINVSSCTGCGTGGGGGGGGGFIYDGSATTAFTTFTVIGASYDFSNGITSITVTGGTADGKGSPLAVTTGTFVKFDGIPVSSPTTFLVFSSAVFKSMLAGASTNFMDLNYASVTVQGDVLLAVRTSTGGLMGFVSVALSTTVSQSDWNIAKSTTVNTAEWNTAKSTTVNISAWETAKSTTVNISNWETAKSTTVNITAWNLAKSTTISHVDFVGHTTTADTRIAQLFVAMSTAQTYARVISTGFITGFLVVESSLNVKGVIVSSTGYQVAASTIQGNLMIEGGSITFRNGSTPVFGLNVSSALTAGQHLVITKVTGQMAYVAGGGDDAGSGSVAGNSTWYFVTQSTEVLNMGKFAIHASSSVQSGFILSDGSATVRGVIVSSTGYQVGASTVQGSLMVEGGSFCFRNGSTAEFCINFASGGYALGDRLIVTNVAGNRFQIASGKASVETGSGGGGGGVWVYDGGVNTAVSTFSFFGPFGVSDDISSSGFSTMTILGSTNPYRTISIPAASWIGVSPSSASGANNGFVFNSTNSGYNRIGEFFHVFNPVSTTSWVTTTFRMPFEWDGSSIGFQVSWFASTGPAFKNVGWSLSGVAITSGVSIFQSDISSATTFSTFISSNQEVTSSMSPGYNIQNVPAPGCRVKLNLTTSLGGFTGLPRMTEVLLYYRQAVWDGRFR